MNLTLIFEQAGLEVKRFERIAGGDISQGFRLHGNDKKYFLKLNKANLFPGMFEKEARGLHFLGRQNLLKIPAVIGTGVVEEAQYLVLEWLEEGEQSIDFWSSFGAGLGCLHRQTNTRFGWEEDNFIGHLPQQNTWCDDWAGFYATHRLSILAKQLYDTGSFGAGDMNLLEELGRNLGNIFPDEPPALVHGDLWSGNFLVDASGSAAIFDPAVYFGHREMDLGMTKLFGGFAPEFYTAYQEQFPLAPGWEVRIPLTQLYPVLVHAILFGGHYVEQARQIIKQYS